MRKKMVIPQDIAENIEFLQQIAIKHNRNNKISFFKIKDALTPEVITFLGSIPNAVPALDSLFGKITQESRDYFIQHIFKMRQNLSPEVLFKIWFKAYTYRANIHHQQIELENGDIAEIGVVPEDKNLLKGLPLTESLMIDNRVVCHRYCQLRKPGWEMLRYANGRRNQTLPLPDMLRQAIEEDSFEAFSIFADMSGAKLSFSMLCEIMEKNAVSIFRELLQSGEAVSVISLNELCAYITVRYYDDTAILLLEEIEKYAPGTIADCHDCFGRNLLFYLMYNMRTGWIHPNCKLTPFLLEKGCDPHCLNGVGLSWWDITGQLTSHQKEYLMRQRYMFLRGFRINLRLKQPESYLYDPTCTPEWERCLRAESEDIANKNTL